MPPKTIGLIAHPHKKDVAQLVTAVTEEFGKFVGAIERIEANVAMTPQVACLDPLSAALPWGASEGVARVASSRSAVVMVLSVDR